LRSIPIFCLAAALACIAAPASAQLEPDTTIARPGTRMRVANGDEGEWRTGRFWFLRADTLWLLNPENAADPVPLAGGERIEITRGRRREAWSGGFALLGGALGFAASKINGHEAGPSGTARNASEMVLAGLGGALVGGLAGWFVAPQRWHEVRRPPAVPPPPPAAASAPQPAQADTAASQ
jgi:hypothetical protein